MPQLFAPFALMPTRGVKFVIRGTGDVAALAASVQARDRRGRRQSADLGVRALDRLVAASVARPRFYTSLLAVFAASALLLAAVGLFGVLSYSVLQRSREIGVRLALGARASQVTRMVVGSALRLVGLGLAIGVIGALAAGQVIRSQLFGVQPTDPLTLGAVTAVLVGTALAASYLPARRASSLDPGKYSAKGECQRSPRPGSTNDEALLVEQDPVFRPELDPPVCRAPTVHGSTAEGAVAVARVGANPELCRPKQPRAVVPPMVDCGVRRRLDARVEVDRARIDRRAWRNAVPIAAS